MSKKDILFITPVVPSLTGRGRHFRAFYWVRKLQKKWNVSVFCTTSYGKNTFWDEEGLKKLDCRIYLSDHPHSKPQRIKSLLSLRPGSWYSIGKMVEDERVMKTIPKPKVILCFRLQNAPLVMHLKKRWNTDEIWLDIDELDSRVRFNFVKHMFAGGYFFQAIKELVESFFYSIQESRMIPEFDTVYTSTMAEKNAIDKLGYAVHTEVKQNMFPALDGLPEKKKENASYTFMFVGNSRYFPNLDAIDRILFVIVPELEKVAKQPFKFVIIGGDVGKKQRRQIRKLGSVILYRDVENLQEVYHHSQAVVVPLKTGGGSSLKFLEALSYKKPVVATQAGVRGFGVTHGEHALIGETSEELIQHCLRLINDTALNRKLAESGYRWFLDHHSFQVNEVGAAAGHDALQL